MQTSTILVAVLFAITSLPFIGQSSSQDTAPGGSGAQQQTAPSANQAAGAVPSSQPEQASPQATPPPVMRPVTAELVNALDSKTAKAGDNVVVQTNESVKLLMVRISRKAPSWSAV